MAVAFSPDLALDITPLTEDIDLAHAEGRLFVFAIPKSVLTCSVITSIHFKDLNLNEDREHINDVVLYCFISLLLSSNNQEFVKRTFSDFYVHVSYNPQYITFVGVVREDHNGASVFDKAAENAVVCNSFFMGLTRLQQANSSVGSVGGGGAGGAGGDGGGGADGSLHQPIGPAGKGAKRKRAGPPDLAVQKSLRFAADHLGMKAVPTFTISKSAAFAEKLESWGHLISSEIDLGRVLVEWIARRFAEAGRQASVRRVAPAGYANNDGELGLECDVEIREGANTFTLQGNFWAFLSAENPLYTELDVVRPCFRIAQGPFAQCTDGVYRMGYFRVDMSYLFHRFFSRHDIFARFDVFSERVRGTGDEYLANPAGDVECLSRFFEEFASFRTSDKLASANLVFDTFSRRSGLLPKSVRRFSLVRRAAASSRPITRAAHALTRLLTCLPASRTLSRTVTSYDFNTPGWNPNAGHFTQVVWKGSTSVGCGAADCTGHSGVLPSYVVCRYAPAGNMDTTAAFKANVLPCGSASTASGGCTAISLAGAPKPMGHHRKLMSSQAA
jgi:hypothetical protein